MRKWYFRRRIVAPLLSPCPRRVAFAQGERGAIRRPMMFTFSRRRRTRGRIRRWWWTRRYLISKGEKFEWMSSRRIHIRRSAERSLAKIACEHKIHDAHKKQSSPLLLFLAFISLPLPTHKIPSQKNRNYNSVSRERTFSTSQRLTWRVPITRA